MNARINTMLYGILSKEYDYYNKSYLLCTWNDGAYFYMVPYDLDSTWGLYWDGSKIMEDGSDPYFDFEGLIQDANRTSFISNNGQNRLFERIYKHFKSRVKKQWDYLRQNVWRNSDISGAFKKFISEIPQSAYEREQARWPTLPSKNITDYEQIQKFIIERGDKMDNYMDKYYFPETDPLEDIKNRLTKLEQK
ncbi:CotH kinase family protein [Lactobacillus johnsonii]|uniref:CotH kinase family protein n=1 Tax=Lactobacillus johnsonii TaxID=33959 RepID=UPI0022E22CF0|nr:CotH kinase family protein [Lactobacillus johnsonii]